MESLGYKLRTTREERDLSFEQVSRDTNIAVRYLEALETEFFDNFPGEAYITGFLRTYGTYLGLNPSELISLYRAHKIQEQPVPVELLKKPSPVPKIILTTVIVLLIVGGAGGGVYYFLNRPEKPVVQAPVKRVLAEYSMTDDLLERRLYTGDVVFVPLENSQYKLELGPIGDTVTIHTPAGSERLDLGQSVAIDLNRSGGDDVYITVVDFARNKADMGALIRIEPIASMIAAAEEISENIVAAPVTAPPVAVPTPASTVVFSSPNAYPFTLQSSFQGYCLFRWEILREADRRGRNEQYFQRADEFNIQVRNGIRIWVSNAQAAKLQIIGGGRTVPVELGGAGEIVVADIHWVRDEDNRFRLLVARLEL